MSHRSPHNKAIVSIFELKNDRGYFCPPINVSYNDANGNTQWQINAGGSRCYVTNNIVEENDDREAASSHFMISRILSALVMSSAGLFQAIPRGRILFVAPSQFSWRSELDLELYSDEVQRIHSAFDIKDFESWLDAICSMPFLRRAIDDLRLAMHQPVEAFVYIYRGFEWITSGLPCTKELLAHSLGVPVKELKELGRIANDDTGVRHATRLVADSLTYSSWMCGLVDAINFARHRRDSSFKVIPPQSVSNLVKISAQLTPYP